ncbi:phytanoyl-CoA dioxygenase domain-containing protein 1 [Culicoides brevitarsis]|uniref:phytanoyl-CoA dioxygenase domain-containing protein 1 n=1 Tax=Culicoides brevitarsis TaxID=469753 RepID=UPI00307BE1B4
MGISLVEKFEQDGFAVVEDFLLPEEIEELYEAGKDLCYEVPEEIKCIFDTVNHENAQNKDTYFLDSGDKVHYFYESNALSPKGELLVDPIFALNKVGHALHTERDIFRKYTFSYRVKDICYQLGFKKPAIPQSMYIYKNPNVGGEVKAHQDGTYLYTEPASAVGFWIALDDATPQNGCLQFIKGSHKNGVHTRYVLNPDKNSKELLIYEKPTPIYPLSNFTSVPVKKGSLILIHNQVVHRSDNNRSNDSRHAYAFHVIETQNCVYAKNNWNQPKPGKPFPLLYSIE